MHRWTRLGAVASFSAMPHPPSSRALSAILVVAALVAIVSADGVGAMRMAHYIAKPLATVAILAMAVLSASPISQRYKQFIVVGLVCSLVGDVLLMLPGDYFVPGLVAFLLAHLCYLSAFLRQSRFAARPVAYVGYLMVSAALLSSLLPSLPRPLVAPVLVYVVVITAMAAQSSVWMLESGSAEARRAAIGAAWFVVSDATLAIARFRMEVPYRDLIVLGTYFVAQWCIARSVSRALSSDAIGASPNAGTSR